MERQIRRESTILDQIMHVFIILQSLFARNIYNHAKSRSSSVSCFLYLPIKGFFSESCVSI